LYDFDAEKNTEQKKRRANHYTMRISHADNSGGRVFLEIELELAGANEQLVRGWFCH
jgi:hypothetical protein